MIAQIYYTEWDHDMNNSQCCSAHISDPGITTSEKESPPTGGDTRKWAGMQQLTLRAPPTPVSLPPRQETMHPSVDAEGIGLGAAVPRRPLALVHRPRQDADKMQRKSCAS